MSTNNRPVVDPEDYLDSEHGQSTSYLGQLNQDGLTVFKQPSGTPLRPGPSQQLVTHSNDFHCGYAGSGPAQLALAILLDYYDSDRIALAYYQEFKRDTISNLPSSPGEQWELTADDIKSVIEPLREEDLGAPDIAPRETQYV